MFGNFIKRGAAVILSVISVAAFTACNGKGVLVKTPDLNIPFETNFKLQSGELEVSGSMKRYGTGIWELEADSPETLAGLSLSYGDEGVRASLDDLKLEIPMEKIRDGAVFAQIFKAVDSAAASGELRCTETENGKVFSGEAASGPYSITFDPESLVPVRIEIPAAGITAELENFKPLDESKPMTGETAETVQTTITQ